MLKYEFIAGVERTLPDGTVLRRIRALKYVREGVHAGSVGVGWRVRKI